jgi:uncharacterized protein (TIGR03067 family)
MRYIAAALASLILLVSISRADEPTPEQKKRIEELQKQLAEKKAEIAKIEAELAKLLPSFNGYWSVIETEIAGKVYKTEEKKHTWDVLGSKLTLDNGTNNPRTHRLVFDSSVSPPRFDLFSEDRLVYRGIYKFDGTDLIICYNPERKERPVKFATEGDGSGFTLQRLKPAKK